MSPEAKNSQKRQPAAGIPGEDTGWTTGFRLALGLRDALDKKLTGLFNATVPFYRRYPYRGPLGITEVDTRGAISVRHKFLFSRVPKAANSTVTMALALHSRTTDGALNDQQAKRSFRRPVFCSASVARRIEHEFFAFTFVRNPYARTLSAYLDKIAQKRFQSRHFYYWFRPDRPREPEFADFCHYLLAGGIHDDIHWAPQTDVLLLPVERFDFIGRVETLQTDLSHVLWRIFGAKSATIERSGPRTDSHLRKNEYATSETQEILGQLYKQDFLRLGYEIG